MRNEKKHFHVDQLDTMTDAEAAKVIYEHKHVILGNYSIWVRQHPDRAAAIRAEGVKQGLVHETKRQQNIAEHARHQPQRQVFTEEILRARYAHPPSELDRYYKNSTSELHQIKKSALAGDAEAAARLYQIELSAHSHGVIPHPPTRIEVKKSGPATFEVSAELCDRYGLPRGTQTTQDEFFSIVTTFAKLQVEKKAAAEAEKAAA